MIVSELSNPWLTDVSNLSTREYFQLGQAASPSTASSASGRSCTRSPWNIKTILGTVRAEFPYVYVFSAEDWSSDTILIGSMDPLPLDYDVVARAFQDPVTRAEARRGGFQSPHDVFAYLLLGPDKLEAFTAASPINTDDNARIEFAAPRDLLGYAKFEPYRANVYGPMWPYGRLSELVRGYGDGPEKSSRCGALARSLLAHGKSREAELWTRRAEAAGNSPEAQHARLLLNLVSTRLDRDPEIPLAPGEDLAPPDGARLPGGQAPGADREGEGGVSGGGRPLPRAPLRDRLQGAGIVARGSVGGPGQGFSLLTGFLDYKAEIYADAIDELKALSEDSTYVARRPELLYYLGRSYYAASQFTKAVDALERYIRSQTVLGRDVLPGPDVIFSRR